MIARVFHNWERRLASISTDRIARPFEWGADWLTGEPVAAGEPRAALQAWGEAAIDRSDDFYRVEPARDYALRSGVLTFTSAIHTPHPDNNVVRCRYFPDQSPKGRRRAVVVLPQWNSDAEGHVGLCRLLNRFGISALRLSLPYHDARMPPELKRADYIVSSNVGRTAQVCRQAVKDARQGSRGCTQGYESIGIPAPASGHASRCSPPRTSRCKAAASITSHPTSPTSFEGLSTIHVRGELEGNVCRTSCAACGRRSVRCRFWSAPRDPARVCAHDLTFPPISRGCCGRVPATGFYTSSPLPCGHYSTASCRSTGWTGYALQVSNRTL